MRRRTTILLILAALFVMLTIPVVAQDEATAEPTAEPIARPTPAASAGPSAGPTTEPEAGVAPGATTEPTFPPLPTAIASSDGPVVQGVFFFSPTCGHCEYVITQVLPGLFAENGGDPVITFDQSVAEVPSFYLMSNGLLQLLMVDTTQPDGAAMFTADSVRLDLDRAGVPRLDFADIYLVGSTDIPEQFPGMVEEGLAGDGMGWPPVPGLEAAIAPFLADGSVAVVAPGDDGDGEVVLPVGDDEDPLDKIGRDPVGNGISIIVLITLVLSLIAAPVLAIRGSLPVFPSWLVIVLAAIGIVVAAYLASIETSGSEAVCGPVGDCNAVQESEYASLFGIPIGVLGVLGYLAIGGLWIITRVARGPAADWAAVLIALGAFAGTLFSAYLTFLEPFVIGATCMWCITSAIVMMALLWITAGPAWEAWGRLRGGSSTLASAGA